MKTKLTLYWEESFMMKAKRFAERRGITLSDLVEESLKRISKNDVKLQTKKESNP